MNKQSIVEAVHEKLGGTKVSSEQAVETMIETITNSLKKGEEVSIAGLGIFSVKTRAARTARPQIPRRKSAEGRGQIDEGFTPLEVAYAFYKRKDAVSIK